MKLAILPSDKTYLHHCQSPNDLDSFCSLSHVYLAALSATFFDDPVKSWGHGDYPSDQLHLLDYQNYKTIVVKVAADTAHNTVQWVSNKMLLRDGHTGQTKQKCLQTVNLNTMQLRPIQNVTKYTHTWHVGLTD